MNFNKSTVFKAKIEKKSKEECLRENDIWLDDLAKKGIKAEIYNPNKTKKKEEKTLDHGVQKSEILSKNKYSIVKSLKNFCNCANDLRINNPIQFYLYWYLTLIILILLGVIFKLSSLNNKYEKIINNQSIQFELLMELIKNTNTTFYVESSLNKK